MRGSQLIGLSLVVRHWGAIALDMSKALSHKLVDGGVQGVHDRSIAKKAPAEARRTGPFYSLLRASWHSSMNRISPSTNRLNSCLAVWRVSSGKVANNLPQDSTNSSRP